MGETRRFQVASVAWKTVENCGKGRFYGKLENCGKSQGVEASGRMTCGKAGIRKTGDIRGGGWWEGSKQSGLGGRQR